MEREKPVQAARLRLLRGAEQEPVGESLWGAVGFGRGELGECVERDGPSNVAGEVGQGVGLKSPSCSSWLHLPFLVVLQDTPPQHPSPTLPRVSILAS